MIFYKTLNRGQTRKNFNLSKSYLLSKNFWYIWKLNNLNYFFTKKSKNTINLNYNFFTISSILNDFKKIL